ncbi:glycosyltransferase [Saccharicrinis sp. FJH2]|uniref:glycosyltransferase family 2 protein n=1 Tax=unclassified Saccharicrinis TaxID=2646859 RepID=UPI0035D4D8CC
MTTLWDNFFEYWYNMGFEKIVRLFWYFFFLEVPRYIFFEIVVLLIFVLGKKRRNRKFDMAKNKLWLDNPLVSIIVPGKNEGKHIYKLVLSLKEQTWQNYELIIIDDGSSDDTPTICRNLEKQKMIDRFLRNENRGGKASAANFGLRYTKGKYIVHLDADCSMDRDAIEQVLLPFYIDPKVKAVGGNVKVRNHNENVLTTLEAIEYLFTISMGRIVTSFLGIYKIVSGAFGAFDREVISSLGGWDIGPGLDGDITVKVRKRGYKIAFADRAVCLTSVPNTPWKLTKQRLRWSKSLVRFRLRKHFDVLLPQGNFNFLNFFASFENIFFNLVMDFLWFYYIIGLIITNIEFFWQIFFFKLFLYIIKNFIQFAVAMGFSERKSEEWKYWIYVPLMFFYVGVFMRIVRTFAYVLEMFWYSSYKDPWNPAKSSRQARDMGI